MYLVVRSICSKIEKEKSGKVLDAGWSDLSTIRIASSKLTKQILSKIEKRSPVYGAIFQ